MLDCEYGSLASTAIMTVAELLREALKIKGVTGAAVVSSEGLVIEGVSRDDADFSSMAELIVNGLASSKVLAELLGEGEMTQAIIEYESGPVLLAPLGAESEGGFVSVITLASTSQLGRVRFQLGKLLPELERVLQHERT